MTTAHDEPTVSAGGTGLTAPRIERAPSPHPAVAAFAAAAEGLPAAIEEAEGWVAIDSLLAVLDMVSRGTAVAARLLSTVEADGLWATTGSRSVTDWMAVSSGLPFHRARELVQTSRALRDHLPLRRRWRVRCRWRRRRRWRSTR